MKWDREDDVPQEIIRHYSDEIARKYELASDRIGLHENYEIEEQNLMEELQENESNNTGGARNVDSEDDDSEIDEKIVFLDEKQQKQRR